MARSDHFPVLWQEVVHCLEVALGSKNHLVVVDGTLGFGGHFQAIQRRFGNKISRYYGLDFDRTSLASCSKKFSEESQLELIYGNFRKLPLILGPNAEVDCVLLDLGTHVLQYAESRRGLSLFEEGPLDFRLNPDFQVKTALDYMRDLSVEDWVSALMVFTQIRKPRSLVLRMKEFADDAKANHTTQEFLRVVKPYLNWDSQKRVHPATALFLCIRAVVNDETGSIQEGLPRASHLLRSGGLLMVISFNSAEHRLVRKEMNKMRQYGKILTKKPIRPSSDEVAKNPPSRSAQLRVFQKL
jgi:16S rRNA (cytosine1402-N4)-methyltransferase